MFAWGISPYAVSFFRILMVLCSVYMIYIFAYTAGFRAGMKLTFKNAGIMSVVHFPTSLLILAGEIVCGLGIFILPILAVILPEYTVLYVICSWKRFLNVI